MSMSKPSVSIYYCPGCRWLPRACWMSQELLETFSEDLESVSLHPADASGTYQVFIDDQLIWDRREEGGFPQPKELKQRIRDHIAPDKDLGHIDR